MTQNKKVLLTGAGFSANFGAPVASQIWNNLFNYVDIQNSERLRQAIKRFQHTSDFEGFYEEIVYDKNANPDEKRIVVTAIIEIYERLNSSIGYNLDNPENHGINTSKLFYFLKRFSNIEEGKGFIFTLNQDLLLEKLINNSLRKKEEFKNNAIYYPGCINPPHIEKTWKSALPTKDEMDTWISNDNLGGTVHNQRDFPFYVKLHGSSGWLQSNSKLSIPVIGKNKSQQIKGEPLLKWYLDLFKSQLMDKIDIWVIGYSFSDTHINEVLIESINKYRSSLYVIDIKSQNEFMDSIKKIGNPLYHTVDRALSGYFPYSLKQIFPSGRDLQSYHYEMVERSLSNRGRITALDALIEV